MKNIYGKPECVSVAVLVSILSIEDIPEDQKKKMNEGPNEYWYYQAPSGPPKILKELKEVKHLLSTSKQPESQPCAGIPY